MSDPVAVDKAHCWHPFTQQQFWCAEGHEPLMIERAEGVWLYDTNGNRYLDGNASIWTNIHGHCRPEISSAIAEQAKRLDHSSYLGLGHPLASELALRLTDFFPSQTLERVFFSDNGSTAVEVALKMSLQVRLQTGEVNKRRFLAFDNAYHGDTLGAASLGGVSRFFERFQSMGFDALFISNLKSLKEVDAKEITAVIIEPLIQGVNQMTPWPQGMLNKLHAWCDQNEVHLILDEVMTGFGRTGTMFACQQEEVIPDFLCLAKGLTGGSLPLAATLTTNEIYRSFLGGSENVFYYGHSYTANPIGCAAAIASLKLFETDQTMKKLPEKIAWLSDALASLQQDEECVIDVRQCGLIAGIQLKQGLGLPMIQACREQGLITRNILDTIVFMPPLSIEREELEFSFHALRKAFSALP